MIRASTWSRGSWTPAAGRAPPSCSKAWRCSRERASPTRARRGPASTSTPHSRAARGPLLLDDIERSNAPGSRHARRWQDLVELLDEGIPVLATLDAFRLESLNDVVLQITGVRVADTVPDSILERADEIELVDVPPGEIAARRDAAAAEPAADPFADPGILLALRELALRQAAEKVEADIRACRRDHAIGTTWPASERVLACVGPSPSSAGVVRAAARIAAGLHSPWAAAYVEAPGALPMRAGDRERLQAHLQLAESLGGEVVRLSGRGVGEALLRHAQERNVTRIVVGRPTHSRLRDLLKGSIVNALVRGSGGIEVHFIAGRRRAGRPRADLPGAHARWNGRASSSPSCWWLA